MKTNLLLFVVSFVVMLLVFCLINYVREETQLLMHSNIIVSFINSLVLAFLLPRLVKRQDV